MWGANPCNTYTHPHTRTHTHTCIHTHTHTCTHTHAHTHTHTHTCTHVHTQQTDLFETESDIDLNQEKAPNSSSTPFNHFHWVTFTCTLTCAPPPPNSPPPHTHTKRSGVGKRLTPTHRSTRQKRNSPLLSPVLPVAMIPAVRAVCLRQTCCQWRQHHFSMLCVPVEHKIKVTRARTPGQH